MKIEDLQEKPEGLIPVPQQENIPAEVAEAQQIIEEGGDLSTDLEDTKAGAGVIEDGGGYSEAVFIEYEGTHLTPESGFDTIGVESTLRLLDEDADGVELIDDSDPLFPTEPEQPEEPEDPDEPEDPEDPEQPEEPDEPEDPGQPEDPEDPEDPEQPEEPDEPEDSKDNGNKGHGNNTDGQDDDNPGQGSGGPNQHPKDGDDEDEGERGNQGDDTPGAKEALQFDEVFGHGQQNGNGGQSNESFGNPHMPSFDVPSQPDSF